MIPAELLREARQLLARLELVSHGRTMRLEPSRGGGEAVFPPGGVSRDDDRDVESLILRSHLHYRRRIAGARSEETLLLVIGEMEQTLRSWTHSAPPPRDSQAWKEMIARDPRKARFVAAEWKVKATYVHQLRRQFGTNRSGRKAA